MKMTNTIKLTAVALAAAFGLAITAAAQDAKGTLPPASTKTGVTYATDIKPIFDASCVKCHSGDRPKGRLKLDNLDNALKGGKDGKILTTGDSANSYRREGRRAFDLRPDVLDAAAEQHGHIKPLTADQIGLIRAWIDQGAK